MSIIDNINALKTLDLTELKSLSTTLQFHLHSGDVVN